MNVRPRCREWLPLSTQQLRLRNLRRIQGVNIICQNTDDYPMETLLHYTLHFTPDSEPFYQSELLPYRKHLQQMWAEIQCEALSKSNSNYIYIKIWCQRKTDFTRHGKLDATNTATNHTSAFTTHLQRNQEDVHSSKTLLLSWAVHFSGLIPIIPLAETKCQANCLIFQMNDEYFTSPDYFIVDKLREQISLKYERYMTSLLKTSTTRLDGEYSINSPRVSRSSSPTNIDWHNDIIIMAKMRYNEIRCKKSEIRNSYSLDKLLRLQQLQRLRLKTEQENKELVEQIKRISIRCITKEQVVNMPRLNCTDEEIEFLPESTTPYNTSSSSNYSIGRTVKMILAEQERINPYKLLKAKKLQQQLESLYSKERLLVESHNAYTKRISDIREQFCHTLNARQQLAMWLKVHQEKLTCDMDDLKRDRAKMQNSKIHQRLINHHIERRMSTLCMELQEIYPIFRNNVGLHTICDVPYPSLELEYFDYNTMRSTGGNLIYTDTNISPIALGVSLGYVAHLVQIMATILNRPLRNPLICEGSRSRIVDAIQEIHGFSREFPLYCRSVIPTTSVKTAVYLLNQNITQLCYDVTGNPDEIYERPILENILHIYEILNEIQNKSIAYTEEEEDHAHNLGNHFHNCLYELNSSIDTAQDFSNCGISYMPTVTIIKGSTLLRKEADLVNSIEEIDILNTNVTRRRVCRSVGSYTDNEDDFQSAPPYSRSDTNLKTIM